MSPSDQEIEITPEQEKQILESPPKGTFFIIVIFALIMTVAWAGLFFGRFLANGPVN